MLVLTRKLQEQIVIGDNIKVTILRVKGNTVRIGIEAPREVRVVRAELPPEELAASPPVEATCFRERGAAVSSSAEKTHRSLINESESGVPRCPAPLASYLVGLVAQVS